MTDREKLSAASYEKMHSGFLVKDEKDVDKGPKTDISIKPDENTAKIDMKQWEKAVKNCASFTRRNAAGDGQATVRIVDVSEKEASRVYKPSYRRTAEGFNRYIKALDGSMGNNLASLKEELNEQTEA